jgi:Tfp pilus assembly ATPase PilU
MQSMDSELMRLYRDGKIAAEEAYLRAADKKSFEVAFGWSTEAAGRGGQGRAAQPEAAGA